MSRRQWPSLFAALAIAVAAAGCTPFWERPLGPEIEERPARSAAAAPDAAETRLAEAAERAEAALTALARIGSAGTPSPPAAVPVDVPAALRRAVTLDWIGPVETLARTMAAYAGYRFSMAGAPPVRPVMVTITAEDTPLIEVLRDAGLQAGAAATLVVDAGRRTVRLDWTGERPGAAEHGGPGDGPGAAPGKEGS